MAEPYLAELQRLVDEWRDVDKHVGQLECRHFFSGAAAYRDGNIVASLTPVGLALKVPATVRDLLLSSGRAESLRYFSNGPVKKDYALFPSGVSPATAAQLLVGEEPKPG